MSRFFDNLRLRNKQRYVDKLYEEEGLSDRVVRLQTEINIERHNLDMHDDDEITYDENHKEYVQ